MSNAIPRGSSDVRVLQARVWLAMFPQDTELPARSFPELMQLAGQQHAAAQLLDSFVRDVDLAADAGGAL